MSGMYPDDQLLEIFGEQILYPGLHPETHKFTDGDFSNPLVKPSHIPASTFNLIIDNMENLIRAMGMDPNNTDPQQLQRAVKQGFAPRSIGEYHDMGYELSAAELVRLRYLPLRYQIIEIALYEELCANKYVGNDKNSTADWWYKCDQAGNRTITGLYMRVEDARGLFRMGAGTNAAKFASEDTPYEGKDVGEFSRDMTVNAIGSFTSSAYITGGSGVFATSGTGFQFTSTANGNKATVTLDLSRQIPTGPFVKPASISANACISY